MEKIKYQVFLSSTYIDLSKERKKVIDLCDYYILILGKRYGSINDSTGISYTEMEYNYAIEKGIPVLVFALDNSVSTADEEVEEDDIKKGKLAEFKNKAMKNRLASVWRDTSELMGKVAISIMQAKSEIKRPGWRRGNNIDNEDLLNQILSLKNENEELKKKFSSNTNDTVDMEIEFYQKEISLHYTETVYVFTSSRPIREQDVRTTLSDLFKFVSLRITGIKTINAFVDEVSAFVSGYHVSTQDALKARNWFEQLNLIESFIDKDNVEKLKLTSFGRQIMNDLNN